MDPSVAPRARVGYLTVTPGLDLKQDKLRLNLAIDELEQQARQRIAAAGLELVEEPTTTIVEGTEFAISQEPGTPPAYTSGPSVGIFVEVHVRSPGTPDEL
jgi:hypothetical protein